MESASMNRNEASEEANSQVDKMSRTKIPSLTKMPIWLVTSIALLLGSLIPFIYLYLQGLRSKPRRENFSGSQPIGAKQADGEIIKSKPIVENTEQPGPKGITVGEWLNTWSLPALTMEQVKKTAGFAAGPILALVIAYFAQGIFGSTIGEGGMQT